MKGRGNMPLYSHSRLSSFEQCRLKYKFSYIDRIPREEQSIEAFMGSCFHETMEKLYLELPFRKNDEETLKAYFNARWEKNFGPHIHIVKKEGMPEDYRAVGLRAVGDYVRRYAPFDEARTIGVERRLIVDLDGSGRRRVQCYLDRISRRADGVFEIHDYKTSASLPTQAQLDADRQLGLYEIAVRDAWPDVENVELVWHYVAFDAEMRSRRSAEELGELRVSTVSLIDEVESCAEFPPTESSLCPYCSFQDICPLFAHLFRGEALPARDYGSDDGVALVDRYTELEARKRELKAEARSISDEEEKIREAAIALAEREGVARIFGRDHKLTVRKDLTLRYPKSGEKGRGAFEKAMRESGLWERCADVNYMSLHGVAKREGWLKGVPEALAGLIEVEPHSRVTLSKRDDLEEE